MNINEFAFIIEINGIKKIRMENENGQCGQMNGIFHKPWLDAISLSEFETVVDEFQEIYGNSQINR